MRLLPFLALLVAASFAPAQVPVVSPDHFTDAEADSNNVFPFGVTTSPFRYLQAHDDLRGTPRVVQRISTRRDAQDLTARAAAAYTLTLSIWCSTAATSAFALDPTFDNNHGTDKAQVLNSRVINFPATTPTRIPDHWDFQIPFDTPFIFTAQGPFCLEVHRIAHTGSVSAPMDFANSTTGVTNPPLATLNFGAGCRVTGNTAAMQARGGSAMNWPAGTGTLTVTGTNGPTSSFVLALVGFNSETAFGSIPLPFSLPGSAAAPSGECFLHTDVALTFAAPTDAGGGSTTSIPVPATPDLHGLGVYSQLAAADAVANPMGLVTSNGVGHGFVAPYGPIPGSRMWTSGNLNPTGTIRVNQLLVVRLD